MTMDDVAEQSGPYLGVALASIQFEQGVCFIYLS